MNKLYRNYEDEVIESQEYFDHVSAMTKEELHSKAAIAGELAFRDIQLKEANAKIDILDEALDKIYDNHNSPDLIIDIIAEAQRVDNE